VDLVAVRSGGWLGTNKDFGKVMVIEVKVLERRRWGLSLGKKNQVG